MREEGVDLLDFLGSHHRAVRGSDERRGDHKKNGVAMAEESEDLDERQADEHGGAQLAGHLGLARHALDVLPIRMPRPMPGPMAARP